MSGKVKWQIRRLRSSPEVREWMDGSRDAKKRGENMKEWEVKNPRPNGRLLEESEMAPGDVAMWKWLEGRAIAKQQGEVMWKWLKANPKPGELVEVEGDDANRYSRVAGRVNAINHYRERGYDLKKDGEIPEYEEAILEEIDKKKEAIKKAAKEAVARGSSTELKTLYKVIKRLDSEYKKIVFQYSFKMFDEYLFQDIQDRVDTADFHFEMVGMYNTAKRSCVVCPRGHAKSTTARKYILHQMLYGKTTYTIIVGASEDMAAQNLRWVRDQFTDNQKLIDLYGWLKNKDKWADTEFQTSTGIKVTAKGAGQKIRGANEKGRPDLLYIDDLEEDEQVSSRDRRDKLREWFTKALLPAKSRNGRVIMTGTILHMNSLLRNIAENKVKDHLPWQVLWYEAISVDKEGKEHALWEAHKPLSELRALREIDPQTFSQEYQNNPTSGAMAVFDPKEYRYIRDEDVDYDEMSSQWTVQGRPVNTLVTTDLAVSEREGADYTVFMVTGMDSQSNLYVLEYERFRSSDPYEQIEMLFGILGKWHCEMLTMETVAFQKTFKRIFEIEMDRRGVFFYIHEMGRSHVRKIFRIKSLRGPIRSGRLMWKHDHVELEDELAQVTSTRLGAHDDVVDALADAWEIQIEIIEDNGKPKAKINTTEWLIEQGRFPTVVEEMGMEASLYG